MTRPAPLQDWPNHVARIHIVRALLHDDAFWTQFYRLSSFLVPNAALDLVILRLTHLGLPVQQAAQVFLLATYLVFVAGFCGLAHALGAHGPAKPAFAILLFYGNALFWGLVNYVLGIGLMLGLLAFWLRAARHPWRRLLIAMLGAALLLFTHIVAAAAWVVVLIGFDLHGILSRRGGVARNASWLVAALVVATLLHAMPNTDPDLRIAYAGTGSAKIIAHKLELFAKILLGGSLAQDAASILALTVCILAAAFARPRLAAAPLLASAILAVVTLAMPERIGTGSVLDTRLAILPLLMLAAAIHIETRRLAVAAISAAVLIRTLVLAVSWHDAGQVFRDYREQTANLPAGSLMMVAYATRLPTLSWQRIWSPAITSIATQNVFGDLFVPAIFANPSQQPIALRTTYWPLIQPWNLTDSSHLHRSAAAMATLCASLRFPHIYLTVLYPTAALKREAGAAVLHAQADFLVLDACRLPE